MGDTIKRGILLMNLGSPDSPSVPDLKKYLHEFLMDEKVIDYPFLIRKFLVDVIIVPSRSPKSAAAYQSIWWPEGSPLIVLSRRFQHALQVQLTMPVELAMRYGNPSVAAGFDNLLKQNPGLEEVILLPLFPHYAMSSYEAAAEYAAGIYHKKKYPFRLITHPAFYRDEAYIDALSASIQPYLQEPFDYLLFSYHGVPERHIRKSDITHHHCLQIENCCVVNSPAHAYCYRHQVNITTQLVAKNLQLPKEKFDISFQSRLGRDKWLEPFTAAQLAALPAMGIKKLLVACPAFVSDCLETLEEIAEQGKHIFLENGGEKFTMIPCLNIHPLWVNAIAQWMNCYENKNA